MLVHQDNIKLADFGLSRRVSDTTCNSINVFGVIPYVDPKYLNIVSSNKNTVQQYTLNPKSDVYSVGVLLWQISSGRRPFYAEGVEYDLNLMIDIKNGRREEPIKGTSIEYSNLYEGK